MNKEEFLKRIKEENIRLGEYLIVTEKITDAPLVLGCAYDEGVWIVYRTRERGGHFVIKRFVNENDAFDYFYELVLSRYKRYKGIQ